MLVIKHNHSSNDKIAHAYTVQTEAGTLEFYLFSALLRGSDFNKMSGCHMVIRLNISRSVAQSCSIPVRDGLEAMKNLSSVPSLITNLAKHYLGCVKLLFNEASTMAQAVLNYLPDTSISSSLAQIHH